MDLRRYLFAALVALCVSPAIAQDATPQDATEESTAQPEQVDPNAAVWAAAGEAMIHGPAKVPVLDQATLELPGQYGFVPREQSVKVMEAMGNTTGPDFLGLIYPLGDENSDWFVAVSYEESGYIKDEDAKEWDADELLDSLKEGTEQGNKMREERGIPPIQVTRWVESPTYDESHRHLVWSAEIRSKHGEDPDPGVNYNTYVLGREGYISLNLVTALSSVESDKSAARELLAAVKFQDGKRYEDFNASTDKVAAYGLAALVGGVALKKAGVLGALAVIFAKFGKLIIVGLIAAGAGLVKWFRSRGQAT